MCIGLVCENQPSLRLVSYTIKTVVDGQTFPGKIKQKIVGNVPRMCRDDLNCKCCLGLGILNCRLLALRISTQRKAN